MTRCSRLNMASQYNSIDACYENLVLSSAQMNIRGLLHFNIRCSPRDLPVVEKFYADVLEMKAGYRPNFGFPGAWLYVGTEPLIHVSARFPEGSIAKAQNHTGSVDHIAFKCTGSAEF